MRTLAEAGFPDLWVEGFHGVFGWRGMPDPAREAFSAKTRAVLADPARASFQSWVLSPTSCDSPPGAGQHRAHARR